VRRGESREERGERREERGEERGVRREESSEERRLQGRYGHWDMRLLSCLSIHCRQ